MSKIPNREETLARVEGRMQFCILQTHWHIASATTGHATTRNTAQGREATAEEKAAGMSLGWRPHTNEEKIGDALQTAKRHMENYHNLMELRCALIADDLESYNLCMQT